ncbi:MAG: ATPase AAA [Planctomycetaceae bacterium]|nr:MAG: ATPase AAA [Planctomycetaceae bacterium]
MTSARETRSEEQIWDLLQQGRRKLREELGRRIIGQDEVIEQVLIALFAGGHCLITGAPGLAKTLLVKSLAELFQLKFQRIQFTPDLMPADITGTEILQEDAEGRRHMVFVPGPIFCQVLLADEINRTPPKTQAALLEAMQELQVTAAGQRFPLTPPFFVLATQNPIEMEGTYPLPEAQLDRFMFNVVVDYLPLEDEVAVVKRTTSTFHSPLEPVFTGDDVLAIQRLVRSVPIADELVQYAVQLTAASRPRQAHTPSFINEHVSWGAGLRAGQCLVLGAKARALLMGRSHVSVDDLQTLARPVLRHRILTNYKAEAAGVTVEQIIQRLLEFVAKPLRRP